jgi:hypothetical protein
MSAHRGTGSSNPSPSSKESANFRSLSGGRIGVRTPIGRSPGQPTTHIPADLDRNRKGAPSPLAAIVRRST